MSAPAMPNYYYYQPNRLVNEHLGANGRRERSVRLVKQRDEHETTRARSSPSRPRRANNPRLASCGALQRGRHVERPPPSVLARHEDRGEKLWRIVNECKTGAIRWGVNGNTILLDYKKFQEEYLGASSSIFKTNNITSFIRQLNLYGFRKVTSHNRDPMCNSHNPDVHEFLHESFQAGRMDLLAKVSRKAAPGKIRPRERSSLRNSMRRESLEREPTSPRMTRLQMCQIALTKALEQVTREYHREKFLEESMNDDPLADIANSQEAVSEFFGFDYNAIPNADANMDWIKRNASLVSPIPEKLNEEHSVANVLQPHRGGTASSAMRHDGVRFIGDASLRIKSRRCTPIDG